MTLRGLLIICALCFSAGGCAVLDALGTDGRQPTLASLKGKRVQLTADQKIADGREKAAATYREALSATANPRMEAEALRRLADLELEFAEESLLDTEEVPGGGEFDDAVALYSSVLARHPENPGNDRVLYQLARAQENSGRPADALATLDRLVGSFPESAYIHEAQFRRGEMFFLTRDFAEAEAAYAEVSRAGISNPFFASALYKHGWAQFKQSMHPESLVSFFDLLDHTLLKGDKLRDLSSLGKAERELVDDSLRAVSISFSYFTDPQEVDAWLAGRNPVYLPAVYASLADLYVSQERFADAAQTLSAFVRVRPLDIRAPDFQLRVIETWRTAKFLTRELEARDEFVTRYAPAAPYWQSHATVERPEVLLAVQGHLGDLAKHYHGRYQALADGKNVAPDRAAAATRAVDYYARVLAAFPESESAPRSSFLMAELLFETGRFEQASAAYEHAAYEFPDFDKRAEAGYAALLAYTEHEASLQDEARSAWRTRGMQSALRFADSFPAHPEANAVLLRVAEERFARSEYKQAIELADRVLSSETLSSSALRITALVVKGHAHFDASGFAEAEQAYATVLTLLSQDDARRADLMERQAAAVYKQGELEREQGNYVLAAQAFKRVEEVFPGSDIAAVAQYDAADMLLRVADWQGAALALEAFLARNPEHELSAEVRRRLVHAHRNNQDKTSTARALLAIVETSVDSEEQAAAQWEAAQLLSETQETGAAIVALEAYLMRFGERFETAMEARQKLAKLHGQSGNVKEVVRWQKAMVSAQKAAGDAGTARTRTLAAQAAMQLALPLVAEYRTAKLKAPLKAALKTKKRRMEKALAALTEAADYGIQEVTTRATFEIAAVYGHMGQALLGSERPASLSPEELEQYEMLLEEQAFPFEEKAIELHEANIARARVGLFDEWVQASLSALAELMPARYAKLETSEEAIAQIH